MAGWKETKIGTIPSEWDTKPFEEIIENGSLSYGVVQPGTHREKNSVPILRVNNIRNGKIFPDDVMKIDKEIEAKYKRTRLKGGELLLTVVGSVGEAVIVPDKFKDWNVARAVSVSRVSNKYDKNFIKYCFSTEQIKYQMYSHTNDTVQPTLNLSSLKQIIFPIPPLPEQQAIAEVLRSLDNKIDLLHRQNKTLEALAETLFRQWFVEEAEESWERGTIEDEFNFTMGQSPLGSSLNEDGNGMIFYQGRTDFGFRFPEPRVYTTEPNRLAKKFDTLISVRAPVGDMNIAIEDCCLGRGVAAFRYKSNCNFNTYTFYKLRSLMTQIKLFEDSGTVFGSIGKDDFKKLENIIPPKKIVIKFQGEVSPLDEKIYQNTVQILSLTKLRDSLLPKLMGGEVRVNIAEAETAIASQ
jgi:type I restriction enzyme S subunit